MKFKKCPICGSAGEAKYLAHHIRVDHAGEKRSKTTTVAPNPLENLKRIETSVRPIIPAKGPSQKARKSAILKEKFVELAMPIERRTVVVDQDPRKSKKQKRPKINIGSIWQTSKIVPLARCFQCNRYLSETHTGIACKIKAQSRNKDPIDDSASQSIHAVSGGLPSLGKRSR